MAETQIEWTDSTWNPVAGCTGFKGWMECVTEVTDTCGLFRFRYN
jgi:protein gp37